MMAKQIRRRMFASSCLLLVCQAAIVDRVAIAVGRSVITLSHLETEIRVTAFIEGVKPGPDARKQAASRLIEQTLVRREIELTRFPMPKPEDAAPLLAQVRELHGANFDKDVAEAGLQPQDVSDHLLWQLTLMRFVQYRFQPGVSITDEEAKAYYDAQLPRWAKEGKAAPKLEAIRKDIDAVLTQQRVDELLGRWLAEQREQTSIVFKMEGLAE